MNNVFDFSIVTSWVHEMLTSLMPLGLAIFIECVMIGAMHAADVCRDRHHADLTWSARSAPSSNAASVRCAWGHGDCSRCPATSSRCSPRRSLIRSSRTGSSTIWHLHRHHRLGAGIRLPAHQQGVGGVGLQCGRLLPDGRLVDRRGRHPAGRVEFQQQVSRSSAPCEAVRR